MIWANGLSSVSSSLLRGLRPLVSRWTMIFGCTNIYRPSDSWDMVGAATFSRRFGYMDTGRDHDHSIATSEKMLDYFAAVGQIPFLDFLLDKNPVLRIGPPSLGNVTRIAFEHMIARLQGKDVNFNSNVPDFLQHFLDARDTYPDLDDGMIMGFLLVNLLAGADTTAITIRALFYYALRSPEVYQKLEKEVLAAGFGKVAPYKEARALPCKCKIGKVASRY